MNGNVEEMNWLSLCKLPIEKNYNLQNRVLSNPVTKKHLLTQALPQLLIFVPKCFTKLGECKDAAVCVSLLYEIDYRSYLKPFNDKAQTAAPLHHAPISLRNEYNQLNQ